MARNRDRFDVWLVVLWVLTAMTWLFTFMAAFAVHWTEALVILGISILYTALNRMKVQHRVIRVVMAVLILLAALCVVLFVSDIVSAFNAAPRV